MNLTNINVCFCERYKVISISSILVPAPLLMLTIPFLITAARIIMKIIAAPPTDTSTYKDCRQFTFGVGMLPLLVAGVTHHP